MQHGRTFKACYPDTHDYLLATAKTPERRQILGKLNELHRKASKIGGKANQEGRKGPVGRNHPSNERSLERSQNGGRGRGMGTARITSSPSPPSVKERAYKLNGLTVEKATVHHTKHSYNKAIAKLGTPLREGGMFGLSGSHEFESFERGEHHLRLAGREYLGEASTGRLDGATYPIGARFNGGLWVISPNAIGGRLALAAKQFQEHKMIRATVHYVPSVDATIGGQALMCFSNDPGIEAIVLGDAAVRHASTFSDSLPFQIYEHASMDIHPQSAESRYFDENAGDERLTAQGILQLMATSQIPGSTKYAGVYGNLWLEYEYDFYAPALDDELDDIYVGNFTATVSASTLFAAYDNVLFSTAASPEPQMGATYPPGLTATDSVNYLMYGTIESVTGDWANFTWLARGDTATYNFSPGMGFYMNSYLEAGGAGVIRTSLSTNLVASNMSVPTADSGPTGQLQWAAASGTPTSGTITFSVRTVCLIDRQQ